MRISTIALANLKRWRGKAMFLAIGISIGIGTAVALLSLSGSIKEEIGAQRDRFGANIVVVPPSNSLSLDYGGIIIFGALAHVQSLVGKPGQLSVIQVSALCKDCPIDDIVGQISGQLPHAKVSAIQQSVRARTETVQRLTRFAAAVSVVVLTIGALMIFTTMMGSVMEVFLNLNRRGQTTFMVTHNPEMRGWPTGSFTYRTARWLLKKENAVARPLLRGKLH